MKENKLCKSGLGCVPCDYTLAWSHRDIAQIITLIYQSLWLSVRDIYSHSNTGTTKRAAIPHLYPVCRAVIWVLKAEGHKGQLNGIAFGHLKHTISQGFSLFLVFETNSMTVRNYLKLVYLFVQGGCVVTVKI